MKAAIRTVSTVPVSYTHLDVYKRQIDYHYGKHLQTYVNNLNSLVPSTEFEGKTVEEIVASYLL